jgi:uncharacterized protein (TIGR02145 family)
MKQLIAVFIAFSLLSACSKNESQLIIIKTLPASAIMCDSVTLHGEITDPGNGIVECGFSWGKTPTADSTIIPDFIVTSGSFSKILAGLKPSTTYYYKAYATDGGADVFGEVLSFTTLEWVPVGELATVITKKPTFVLATTATSGGIITNDGGTLITAKGICWSSDPEPTIEDNKIEYTTGPDDFKIYFTGLTINTQYYLRAFATNSAGTAYGNQIIFSTSRNGTFTDSRDGHVYKWIEIANQVWMAENLAWLPSVNPSSVESSLLPFYYVYGYEDTSVVEAVATYNYLTYGVLYNWTAAMNGETSSNENPSGIQGVCPNGWHLPSDSEWSEMADSVGGESIAGTLLKEEGFEHWNNSGYPGTNVTGFTALPGGYRDHNVQFYLIGTAGYWWTSTESQPLVAFYRRLYSTWINIDRNGELTNFGLCVRCIKDN